MIFHFYLVEDNLRVVRSSSTEEELSALLELMLGQESCQVTNSLTLRHSVEIIKHLSLVPGESAKDEASLNTDQLDQGEVGDLSSSESKSNSRNRDGHSSLILIDNSKQTQTFEHDIAEFQSNNFLPKKSSFMVVVLVRMK